MIWLVYFISCQNSFFFFFSPVFLRRSGTLDFILQAVGQTFACSGDGIILIDMRETYDILPALCLQKKGALKDNFFLKFICNVHLIMCTKPPKSVKMEI